MIHVCDFSHDIRARDNSTLLLEATFNSEHGAELCRILLDAGVDINAKSYSGTTALIRACEQMNTDAIRVPARAGADLHQQNNKGNYALYYLVYYNKVEHAKFLIDQGANIH